MDTNSVDTQEYILKYLKMGCEFITNGEKAYIAGHLYLHNDKVVFAYKNNHKLTLERCKELEDAIENKGLVYKELDMDPLEDTTIILTIMKAHYKRSDNQWEVLVIYYEDRENGRVKKRKEFVVLDDPKK
jgi:hypothetical protein